MSPLKNDYDRMDRIGGMACEAFRIVYLGDYLVIYPSGLGSLSCIAKSSG